MSDLTHLLLTRFNLRSGGVYDERYSEAWMAHRMAHFAKWCLPSVSGQDERRFRWLVFFDRVRSEPWMDEIAHLAALGPFEPVFLDGTAGLVAAIDAATPEERPVVTSRLDNDDMLGHGHIAAVRREAEAGLAEGAPTPFVIDVRRVCWWDVARGEIKVMRAREVSPYASLVERRVACQAPETVFAAPHNRLDRVFGAPRMIDGTVLTLIHERNVLNGLRQNGPLERLWMRIRSGTRYVRGDEAARILAEFGINAPDDLRTSDGPGPQ